MPALDGVRGVAILIVMFHAFDIEMVRTRFQRDVDLALDVGWIGVQLFFVLSGFLITGILLDTRGRPGFLRGFFVRRVLRIFPLFYATLIATFVIVPLVTDVGDDWSANQAYFWAYLNNFSEGLGRGAPALPHFWSLAVEEQFYLLWPLAVLVLGRRGIAWLAGAMIGAAVIARVAIRDRYGPDAAYMFTPCRMDALALGALGAAMVRGSAATVIARWRGSLLWIAGTAVLLAGLVSGRVARMGATMQLAGYTIIALGFAGWLLAAVVPGAPARAFAWGPLRRVGTYSYGMYVLHAPLHVYVGQPLLEQVTPTPGIRVTLIYVALASLATFAAAAVVHHAIERPFLALKARLAPRAQEARP
jgi:peptidoglycan/LPS O-acetylase OafA/YrhL